MSRKHANPKDLQIPTCLKCGAKLRDGRQTICGECAAELLTKK